MNTLTFPMQARRQRGMTLIELLIALALSLAVLIGLSSVYIAVKQSFRFQETTGRLQEDANFALDSIAKDLRMAGFAGCAGLKKVVVGTDPAVYSPSSVLSSGSPDGFDGVNPLAQVETTATEVTLQPFTPFNFIRGFDGATPTDMVPTSNPTPLAGNDSLFFSGGSIQGVGVSAVMPTIESPLVIAADTYGWGNATANDGQYDMIVADCKSSNIFKGKVSVAGGVTSIAHDTTLDNNLGTFRYGTSDKMYDTDAIVVLAQWNFFFIATRAGASTPSLYRVTYNGNTRLPSEEVVANVEGLQFHYGENTTVDGLGVPTLVADEWRTTAASVADWSRVVAVRVGLMMVSAEDNANPGVAMATPTLLGQAYTVPAGASANRLRKEFSTTVVLRNSVAPR
jgi:type IV pilus assembly protein PilW